MPPKAAKLAVAKTKKSGGKAKKSKNKTNKSKTKTSKKKSQAKKRNDKYRQKQRKDRKKTEKAKRTAKKTAKKNKKTKKTKKTKAAKKKEKKDGGEKPEGGIQPNSDEEDGSGGESSGEDGGGFIRMRFTGMNLGQMQNLRKKMVELSKDEFLDQLRNHTEGHSEEMRLQSALMGNVENRMKLFSDQEKPTDSSAGPFKSNRFGAIFLLPGQ